MHHGALIYFLWLLFIIFLGVLLLLTVNIIRLNRARRRELSESIKTLGTGNSPLLDEQNPHVRQAIAPNDSDVGGNVVSKPVEERKKLK